MVYPGYIVDEDIGVAESFLGISEGAANLIGVRNVASNAKSPAASFFCRNFEFGERTIARRPGGCRS